jgi:hypothetical protein
MSSSDSEQSSALPAPAELPVVQQPLAPAELPVETVAQQPLAPAELLQAPPPSSEPNFLLYAVGVRGSSPLAALAPSGAAAAELQSAFLEPERPDGGQRWVDLNIASGEDIWSLFLSPSLNGMCARCCLISL